MSEASVSAEEVTSDNSTSAWPPHSGELRPVSRTTVETVLLYLVVCLMVIIILGGSLGNVLVILAIKTTKKLRTSSNAFIVNLAVCDLLLVTMVLPFNIYTYLNDGWDFDLRLCKAVGFLGYSFAGTTLINVCLIAWNRYKLISDPGGYMELFRPRVIQLLIVQSWVVPMLCLLPSLLELWGSFGYVAMLVTCNLYLNHATQSFRLLLLCVRALVPGVLITYCYVVILRLSRQSHSRVHRGLSNTAAYDHLTRRHDLRLTRTMGVICLVFLLSYIPCLVTGIIDWSYMLSKAYHMYCEITVFVASAVNPVIYGLMNSQFREAYYTFLCCPRPQQLTRVKVKSQGRGTRDKEDKLGSSCSSSPATVTHCTHARSVSRASPTTATTASHTAPTSSAHADTPPPRHASTLSPCACQGDSQYCPKSASTSALLRDHTCTENLEHYTHEDTLLHGEP